MKKTLLTLATIALCLSSALAQNKYVYADEQEESETRTKADFTPAFEVGFDGTFSASTFGGSFGLGVKVGREINENLILGVSGRWMRSWTKIYSGPQSNFNVLGGGVWGHYRFANLLYVGAEFELLRSPYKYTLLTPKHQIYPTLLLGGGISKKWNNFRINGGVYYDIIDNDNSPFRTSYFLKRENNTYIPVIYRVGFFFSI